MKYSSCGIRREGVLSGMRSCMVVFMGPYLCLFWRIWKAYADVRLLFLMDLVCSWYCSFRFSWFDPHKLADMFCRSGHNCHFYHTGCGEVFCWLALRAEQWCCCI